MSLTPDGLETVDLRPPLAEFEQAVGRVALTWARLESGLASLLNELLDGERAGWRGRTLYYAGVNLKPRMETIDAAMSVTARENRRAEPALRLWKKLKRSISDEASARRNNIIHGEYVTDTDYSEPGKVIFRAHIVPFFGSQNHGSRLDQKKQPQFDLEEIARAAAAADYLFHAACGLCSVLASARLDQSSDHHVEMVENALENARATRANRPVEPAATS